MGICGCLEYIEKTQIELEMFGMFFIFPLCPPAVFVLGHLRSNVELDKDYQEECSFLSYIRTASIVTVCYTELTDLRIDQSESSI